MAGLTRDADGKVLARLLDLVPGRSGTAYRVWLDARDPAFRAEVKQAALDPFRGYANALRDSLGDAVQVLDAIHVVKLGTQVVDEVRRRVQQEQLDRRGHTHDPRYKIRAEKGRYLVDDPGRLEDVEGLGAACCGTAPNTCPTGSRPASPGGLQAGDPHGEVELAWRCYQRLRAAYRGPRPAAGRRALAEKVTTTFPSCPVPEVARLGRTPRSWRAL